MILTCAAFQEQLPDMFADSASGKSPELRHHLDNCANCAALVRDLQYIAEQARLLMLPTEEPSDNVWSNIQSKLNEPDSGEADELKSK
jgi:hypothetical protein